MEENFYLHLLLDLVKPYHFSLIQSFLSFLGFLGPVKNISSSIDNCSTINITWTAPTVDDRVSIQYYILRIYDAITGSLVDTVSVYDTSYQFVDNDLFRYCYTYVITGVNELGKGISNRARMSYQRGTIHNNYYIEFKFHIFTQLLDQLVKILLL